MEQFLIGSAIATILLCVREERLRRKFKSGLLKVRNAINAAFPSE